MFLQGSLNYQLYPFSDYTFIMRSLTLQNLVIDSLFTCDDQVKLLLAALKALWLWFDALVAVQHVQDAILCVSKELGSQGAQQERETHFKIIQHTHHTIRDRISMPAKTVWYSKIFISLNETACFVCNVGYTLERYQVFVVDKLQHPLVVSEKTTIQVVWWKGKK